MVRVEDSVLLQGSRSSLQTYLSFNSSGLPSAPSLVCFVPSALGPCQALPLLMWLQGPIFCPPYPSSSLASVPVTLSCSHSPADTGLCSDCLGAVLSWRT